MSDHRRKEHAGGTPRRPAGVPSPLLPSEVAEVQRLIERGNSKSALDLAKEIHKRVNGIASEQLLVDAYVARIRSLKEHRLDTEADALMALVRERFPSSRARLDAASAPWESSIEELVRPLADPALPRDQRAAIEAILKIRLSDLNALARCATLPPDHPLRTGAAALAAALQAATTGPVAEEQLSLPEISHRGPLAPWKLLVRAIACFHRRDDTGCETCLEAIDAQSAPARLVPVLRALIGGRPGQPLKPAARALASQVQGGFDNLRAALESLDAALVSRKRAAIYREITDAVNACRVAAPDLLERLRQHIAVRAFNEDLDEDRVQSAMGGPALKNAYFWLLFARMTENPAEPLGMPACSLWEEFRVHAVHEGWFPARGPEAAALYLHMAELLGRTPPGELASERQDFESEFHGYGPYYHDQPASVRAAGTGRDRADRYYLFPERLYERACAIDPRPDSFERWIAWAKGERHWKPAERAAEAWRRALPGDARPLLQLMESAEQRGALQKAIALIEQAERLDALNPQVRRARFRLLVSGAVRHLRRRKPRLAGRELAALEDLPQAQEAGRPAALAALRWICCRMNADAEGAEQQLARASQALDNRAAAFFLFASLGFQCGLSSQESGLPEFVPLGPQDSLAGAVARACAIGDDLGMPLGIPADWEENLRRDLSDDGRKLDASHLGALAEAALRSGRRELAYAASAAGLARGAAAEARFLLLRARALPDSEAQRRNDCIAAAVELARRRRDSALVDEAVELRRTRCPGLHDFLSPLDDRSFSMSHEEVNAVLGRERTAVSFPTPRPQRAEVPKRPWDFALEEPEEEEELLDFEAVLERLLLGRRRQGRPHASGKRRSSQDQGSLF